MYFIFVLPAKNEESSIKNVIESISSKVGDEHKISFIVVSDSSDKTDDIVSNLENVKLYSGQNFGLGYSVFKGVKLASKENPDYIFIIDSDGQVDLEEIKIFISECISNKEIDIFLSSRFQNKGSIKYKYPLINRFGTIILKNIINFFTNIKVTDSHGGIRLFKNKVAKKLRLICDHTYVQEFLIDASQNNFKAKELSSVWLVRKHGKSKVVRSIMTYILNVAPVLFVRLNLHKKLFYGLGFIFLSLAIYSAFKVTGLFISYSVISLLLFICGYILEIFKNLILYLRCEKDL